MPDDLATKERLNIFICHLFLGMIQYLKSKKDTLQFEVFRASEGECITNTNYIKDTAKKMNLNLNISFKSFFFKTPDILTIEISEYKTILEKKRNFLIDKKPFYHT